MSTTESNSGADSGSDAGPDSTDADVQRATEQLSDVDDEALQTWRSLRGFQRDCLTDLARLEQLNSEKLHGLKIKDLLEATGGEDVQHGRLYPNLDELVDMGLVWKKQYDRRTNQYGLTGVGWAVLRAGKALTDAALGHQPASE